MLANIALNSKIRIKIKLLQVCLIIKANNPYTWKVLLEKKHLFIKNISNYSIGAYKELCKGISIAFEAILINTITKTGLKDFI
jgi:hypothetical protein